jgi:hypothetical protein
MQEDAVLLVNMSKPSISPTRLMPIVNFTSCTVKEGILTITSVAPAVPMKPM